MNTCGLRCKYYTERFLGWCLNNKIIVLLTLLSFSLFVSTLVIAGQRNRLQDEINELRKELTTTPAADTTLTPTDATSTPSVTTTDIPTTPTTTTTTTTTTQKPDPDNVDNSENEQLFNYRKIRGII